MSTQTPSAPRADPNLDSFVLRFVRQPAEGPRPGAGWHGIIRHVQSNRERAFNRWDDAVKFINQFIDIAAEESVTTLQR